MPGDNCSVFGCGSCRRTKGIGIWKLPSARNAEYKKWREEWLSAITKTRVIDEDLKKQIDSDKVFTCEKHFNPEDVELFHSEKMVKKKPKIGALPTLNMPKRSHDTTKPAARPWRSVQSFKDLCKRVKTLKTLNDWIVQELEDRLVKPFELSSSILHHVIAKSVDPLLNDDDDGSSFPHQEYWRTRGCAVLFDNGKQC
ncbi:hypothetical protein pdam_00021379, partial [Pocillopora damicornis]